MADRNDIANMALAHIGEEPISSLDENTVPAQTAKTFYEMTYRNLLQSHYWNFAERLQRLDIKTGTYLDFEYSYTLPTNYLRARFLLDGTNFETLDGFTGSGSATSRYTSFPRSNEPYKIRTNLVYTNQANAWLMYTYRAPEQFMPDYFQEAFAYALAAKICMPLTESEKRVMMLKEEAMMTWRMAKNWDSQGDTPDAIEDFPLLAAHLG